MEPQHITLIGTGSWATALCTLLAHNGHTVHWVLRREGDIAHLETQGRNPRYLTEVALPMARIRPSLEVKAALFRNDLVLVATPAAHLAAQLQGLGPEDFTEKVVISAIKGLERTTGDLVSNYFMAQFNVPEIAYCSILGPGHAEEVAHNRETYLTAVSTNLKLARNVAALFAYGNIRFTTSADVAGAELAAVLKNVYAILVGMADGLGFGDNLKSVLVSAASREMAEVLRSRVRQKRDITEAIYLGDLLVTAYSAHSRNRALGVALGTGKAIKDLLAQSQQVAEGYNSVKILLDQHNVEFPFVEAVYDVLYRGVTAAAVFEDLKSELV